MNGFCPSHRAYKGHHEPHVEGTPRSAMTWYVCGLCGAREPRGQGLFYREKQGQDMTDFERKVIAVFDDHHFLDNVTITREGRERFAKRVARTIREIVVEECAKHFEASYWTDFLGGQVATELRALTKGELT